MLLLLALKFLERFVKILPERHSRRSQARPAEMLPVKNALNDIPRQEPNQVTEYVHAKSCEYTTTTPSKLVTKTSCDDHVENMPRQRANEGSGLRDIVGNVVEQGCAELLPLGCEDRGERLGQVPDQGAG